MNTAKTRLEILTVAFKARKNNASVRDFVLKKFPTSGISLATINWYRNKFRREGMKIPSEHELR